MHDFPTAAVTVRPCRCNSVSLRTIHHWRTIIMNRLHGHRDCMKLQERRDVSANPACFNVSFL